MTTRQLILVAAGGAVGATARWMVSSLELDGSFPWMTLLVNLAGCAVLGWIVASKPQLETRALLGTGFCGGLTTFSTMSVEVASLLRDDNALVSWAYVLASVVLGLAAFGIGRLLGSATTAGVA